jgi:hypothetical protein
LKRVRRIIAGLITFLVFHVSVALCQPAYDIAQISLEPNNYARITHGPDAITETWKERLGSNRQISFLAGDFSGDGYDDFACIDFNASNDPYVFVSRSPGKFSAELWQNALRNSEQMTFYFLPGDFDGDGIKDIAAFYRDYAGADPELDVRAKVIYGPDGVNRTLDADDLQFPGELNSSFVAGYFLGGDQVEDFAVISPNGANFQARLYQGPTASHNIANTWAIPTTTVNDVPSSFGAGDFNGDGLDDIAAVFYDTNLTTYSAVIVFGPDGTNSQLWSLGNSAFVSFEFGDFNGDGYFDIAGTLNNAGTRTAIIFEGSETGALSGTSNWALDSSGNPVTAILSGNFNRITSTISGTVFQQDGVTGLAGAVVSAGGGMSVTSDANGRYTLVNVNNGDYTVTVAKNSFTFTPASRVVTVNNLNVSGVNFVANSNPAIFTISGRVYQFGKSSVGIVGATLTATATGLPTLTATTDSTGNYTIENAQLGTYTVTPSKGALAFNPANRIRTIAGFNVTNVDFTDMGVDLCPNDPNKVAPGVCGCGTVDVDADNDGTYDCHEECPNNPLRVVAGACGCDFPRLNEDINENDIPDCNEPNYTIKGKAYVVLAAGEKRGLEGIIIRSAAGQNPTDSDGNYVIQYVPEGNYTFWAREYERGYSISRYFRMNEISGRSCPAAELNLNDHQKTALCKFDPLMVKADVDNLDIFDFKVNGCLSGYFMGESGECILDNRVPTTPVNLTASKGTYEDRVRINFSKAEAVSFYRVYRSAYRAEVERFINEMAQFQSDLQNGLKTLSQSPEFNGVVVGETINRHIDDTTAVPGVHYTYIVRAVNQFGMSNYSNTDEGWRKVKDGADDGDDKDSDGDGVSDDQEEEDGTDPTDPGSFITRLKSPAFTKYNTFLSQNNFLELISTGSATVSAQVRVYNLQGVQIGNALPVAIPPQRQVDVNIHELVGMRDTYGLVRIDFNDKTPGVILQGRMSMYRPNPNEEHLSPDRRTHSFAFTRDLRNPTRGRVFATANSYDPQGQGNLVPNWAEIINLDTVPRAFTVRIYDMVGALLYDSDKAVLPNGNPKPEIVVRPYGELDIQAGHEFGENVYLIEIIPKDGATNYFATIVRYSSNSRGGNEAATYNFAMPVDAKPGSGEIQYVPISHRAGACWSQSNWLELINVREKPISARVTFRDSSGSSIGSTTVFLKPFAQEHLNASALLGNGRIGQAEVIPSDVGGILAQSNVYFHDCEENRTQSAYSSVARIGGEATQMGSFNTYINMSNLLRVLNTANQTVNFNLEIENDGSSQMQSHAISPYASVELGLRNQQLNVQQSLPADRYGPMSITTNNRRKLLAENLRVREVDGKMDFVIPTGMQ